MYGGEEALLAPEEVVDKHDAEDALKRAEKVHQLCVKLVDDISERSREEETVKS